MTIRPAPPSSPPGEQDICRRAILDLLNAQGSSLNDEVIALRLRNLGHLVSRQAVRDNLTVLAARGYVDLAELDPYLIALVSAQGREVSDGFVQAPGISRFRAVIL
jgi:repressor of nif and glnA expression